MNDKHSIFVSHSSEDKITYVEDLVNEIKSLGISVFYDKDVITWGDNLKEKIDELSEENEAAQKAYIGLLCLTKNVLETCIDMLGFEAPERM